MEFLLWFCLPVVVAAGSSVVTYFLMQDRLTLAVERERQLAREARILLQAHQETDESCVAAAEDRAGRVWMEDLLAGRIAGVAQITLRGEPRVLEPRLIQ